MNKQTNITILEDDIDNIETIYHFADVHIKANISGDLHDHYVDLIEKVIKEIKKKTTKSLICICGDIIDTTYSTESIKIIKLFFNKLASLCPIVYIVGSHDLSNKRNLEISDMITPLIHEYFDSRHKIYPLLKEGLYSYGNLIFGVTNMGTLQVVPCPTNKETKNKIKIGLYHGQVSYPDLDSIVKKQCDLDVSQFKKYYDYAFFGDRHSFSYLDKNKTVAYSGSLYEVNYRETGIKKGFIKWNLVKKTSNFIEIDSDIKHVILKVKSNKLENYDKKLMPKKAKIKLIYCDDDTKIETLDTIEKKLKKENNIIEYLTEKDFGSTALNTNVTIGKEQKTINDIKSYDVVIKMVTDHIKENYSKEKNTIESVNKTLKKMVKEVDFNFFEKTSTFKLIKLEFDNINSYGEGNIIDFNLFSGKICEVSGQNGIGKSSILTVLLLGLYNECDIGSKYDCLNIKNIDKCAKIILDFEVNGTRYKIEKKITVRSHAKRECYEDLLLFKEGKDITGQDNVETQKKICNLIGTYDNMIDTNVILQRNYKAFTDLSNNDKKKVISKLSKLDVFDLLAKHVRSELASLQKRVPMLVKQITDLLDSSKSDYIDDENKLIIKTNELQEEIKTLEKDKKDVMLKYDNLNKTKIELEFDLKDYLTKKNISKNTSTLKTIKETRSKLKEEKETLEETEEELNKQTKKINTKKFKDFDQKRKVFTQKNNNEINKLTKEKNKLLMDMTKISFNESDAKEKIISLKSKISSIENDIVNTDDSIIEKYEKFVKLNKELETYQTKNKTLSLDLKKYKEKQENIGKIDHNPKCKFCIKLKNKITFEENIEAINEELSALVSKINKLKQTLKKYKMCKEDYEEYLENISNNKKLEIDLKYCKKDLEMLEKEFDINTKIITNNKRISERLSEVNLQIEELGSLQIEYSNKYDELQEKISNLKENMNTSNKQIVILQTQCDNFENITKEKKLGEIKEKHITVSKKLKIITTQLEIKTKTFMENEVVLKQVVKLRTEVDELKKEKQIVEYINKTLEKDGIQDTILIKNIIPKLQQEVNNLLNTMTNFNIEIKYLNKSLQVYKVVNKKDRILKLSGYEHMILGLCFRLVFCGLSQQKCKFVCFDEIFTFADDNGIQKIGQLFEYIRSRFDFALVISHNDSVKKFCDTSLQIKKDGGFSKIMK
jgi:DNA repair exonuclease SbcCD ATPase subunit